MATIAFVWLSWAIVYVLILYAIWHQEKEYDEPERETGEVLKKGCRFCGKELKTVIDFGNVALAGGFLKKNSFDQEKKYPLRLGYCESCYSVQIADRVKPDVMFKDYFYFSSATETIRNHFQEYAKEVIERFNPNTVIEIGCNDGVLINPLREAGVRAIGVDPSSTVPKGPDIVNDYFTESVAKEIGKVDVIIANNVFAHIEDIHGVTRAIRKSLKDNGVLIIEVHYLGNMLDGIQYDWIYHEHIFYYSLLSLEKHLSQYRLKVFDVKPVDTHGGSMRYYISTADRGETQAVKTLRETEKRRGFDRFETLLEFATNVRKHRDELTSVLTVKKGKTVGYGASGRANAMIQYCGLKLDYIVDDAPAKHGFFTPGSHIPIRSREWLEKEPPDNVLVFAWTYADEIRKKCNLPMIVPFPSVHTVEQ
jgi:SAM-dependent methyltransferase